MKSTLPSEEAVFRSSWYDINEVIGDITPLDLILSDILTRTDVHSLIDLAGVCTE